MNSWAEVLTQKNVVEAIHVSSALAYLQQPSLKILEKVGYFLPLV